MNGHVNNFDDETPFNVHVLERDIAEFGQLYKKGKAIFEELKKNSEKFRQLQLNLERQIGNRKEEAMNKLISENEKISSEISKKKEKYNAVTERLKHLKKKITSIQQQNPSYFESN